MTKIIFLRHAHTKKDPNQNASSWGLSKDGKQQTNKVIDDLKDQNIDIIYISSEPKTRLTIEPLNEVIKKEIIVKKGLDEVKRGDKFLSDEDFLKEKQLQLENWEYKAFDGESGNDAIKRFQNTIDNILKDNQDKTILVVSHGTILNLYFANLLNQNDKISERWQKTGFCTWGILENDKIIKDITR